MAILVLQEVGTSWGKDRCFTLDLQPTEVRVQFAWNFHCGAPRREWAQAVLTAPLDRWVQLVYNGRHSGNYNGRWYYTRRAINVGLFSSLSEDLFTGSQPVDRYSLISALW